MSNTQTEKTVENKPINDRIMTINNIIGILYSNLSALENQLYPILDIRDSDETQAEVVKEPDKLEGKLTNIESDITKINYRIKELSSLLMIERFDG